MGAILLWSFIAIAALDIWALCMMVSRSAASRGLKSVYGVVALVAAVVTMTTTGFFSYFSNPNTHIYGWPIPRVVFQRDDATSPWLDYVGPTIVLAFPMNFILYMFLPSLVFVAVVLSRRRRKKDEAAESLV